MKKLFEDIGLSSPVIVMTLLLTATLISCQEDDLGEDLKADEASKYEVVKITTAQGIMHAWLYDGTPIHKDNFHDLAKADFYDGTTFHRCVKDFVIQGGDPNSKDSNPNNDGQGGPGYTLEAEIDASMYKHKFGAFAAARTNNPQKRSSGSQFYIVTDANGEHGLDGDYTVYGEVIDGMDVAVNISNVSVDANKRPTSNVTMDVDIVELTEQEIMDLFGFSVPK